MNSGPPDATDTERVVQEVLAQLGPDSRKRQGGRHESLLPVQNGCEVQTGGRLSLLPTHRPRIVDGDALLLQKDGLTVEMNPHNGFGHFARYCPSDGYYQVGPNGLPIRTRDKSPDSSQDSRPSKDKATTTHNLN